MIYGIKNFSLHIAWKKRNCPVKKIDTLNYIGQNYVKYHWPIFYEISLVKIVWSIICQNCTKYHRSKLYDISLAKIVWNITSQNCMKYHWSKLSWNSSTWYGARFRKLVGLFKCFSKQTIFTSENLARRCWKAHPISVVDRTRVLHYGTDCRWEQGASWELNHVALLWDFLQNRGR